MNTFTPPAHQVKPDVFYEFIFTTFVNFQIRFEDLVDFDNDFASGSCPVCIFDQKRNKKKKIKPFSPIRVVIKSNKNRSKFRLQTQKCV